MKDVEQPKFLPNNGTPSLSSVVSPNPKKRHRHQKSQIMSKKDVEDADNDDDSDDAIMIDSSALVMSPLDSGEGQNVSKRQKIIPSNNPQGAQQGSTKRQQKQSLGADPVKQADITSIPSHSATLTETRQESSCTTTTTNVDKNDCTQSSSSSSTSSTALRIPSRVHNQDDVRDVPSFDDIYLAQKDLNHNQPMIPSSPKSKLADDAVTLSPRTDDSDYDLDEELEHDDKDLQVLLPDRKVPFTSTMKICLLTLLLSFSVGFFFGNSKPSSNDPTPEVSSTVMDSTLTLMNNSQLGVPNNVMVGPVAISTTENDEIDNERVESDEIEPGMVQVTPKEEEDRLANHAAADTLQNSQQVSQEDAWTSLHHDQTAATTARADDHDYLLNEMYAKSSFKLPSARSIQEMKVSNNAMHTNDSEQTAKARHFGLPVGHHAESTTASATTVTESEDSNQEAIVGQEGSEGISSDGSEQIFDIPQKSPSELGNMGVSHESLANTHETTLYETSTSTSIPFCTPRLYSDTFRKDVLLNDGNIDTCSIEAASQEMDIHGDLNDRNGATISNYHLAKKIRFLESVLVFFRHTLSGVVARVAFLPLVRSIIVLHTLHAKASFVAQRKVTRPPIHDVFEKMDKYNNLVGPALDDEKPVNATEFKVHSPFPLWGRR